jgi:hypothetical protein
VDWKTALTVSVSVVLALAGYVATYVYNLRLAQRKDRLERVDSQLSDLYGPLMALTSAGNSSWLAFRSLYRPGAGAFWEPWQPPTAEEAAAWRLWMTEVFMPLNLQIVDVVTGHCDLLVEREMPQCLLDACAHVAAYRAVLKQWEAGDFTRHTSVINFPSAQILSYASTNYGRLKAEQSSLLGEMSVGSAVVA